MGGKVKNESKRLEAATANVLASVLSVEVVVGNIGKAIADITASVIKNLFNIKTIEMELEFDGKTSECIFQVKKFEATVMYVNIEAHNLKLNMSSPEKFLASLVTLIWDAF